jgi:hypothetical protein
VKQTLGLPVLLAILPGITACPDHDSRLDDAIRQYVDQREAEVQAACECYQLFLNPSDFDHGFFTSKEECLATLGQPSEEVAVTCIKSVLDSSAYGTEDSVDVVKCYTDVIAETADCYAQNAGACSQSACSADVNPPDECQGKLMDAEVEALYDCASR